MKMIKRNRAKCPTCGDVLESISKHHLVACSCYKKSRGKSGIFIEGGRDYLQRGGRDVKRYIEMSEWYEGAENER